VEIFLLDLCKHIKDDKVIVMPRIVTLEDIRDMGAKMETLTDSVKRWSAMITEINGAAPWIPKIGSSYSSSLFEDEEYKKFDLKHKTELESHMGKALKHARGITVNAEGVIAGIEALLVKSQICAAWDPADPTGAAVKDWREPYREEEARAKAYEKNKQSEYEREQGGGPWREREILLCRLDSLHELSRRPCAVGMSRLPP
jgi:hypothetical protein